MRNVLFVCPDNAILGPIAEACLNRAARGRWRAFSAAERPATSLHPAVERLLRGRGHATDALHPKSWEVFALPHAPAPDLLIGLGLHLPPSEPAWAATPERRHWALQVTPGDPARISAVYEAIRAAVNRFLADESAIALPRAV